MIISCSKTPVDLIVRNVRVYTVDDAFSVVQSFAVKDGKIVATGTTEYIRSLYQAKEVNDYSGRYVYPGFNDAHAHFYGYGMNLLQRANLAGTSSQEEIYTILQEYHAQFGGDWIQGRGWDQNNWPEKDFPDKTRLDELFPDVAVYLIRVDGHAAWCNSKALQLAGITASTKVEGGEVVRKKGQPSGWSFFSLPFSGKLILASREPNHFYQKLYRWIVKAGDFYGKYQISSHLTQIERRSPGRTAAIWH